MSAAVAETGCRWTTGPDPGIYSNIEEDAYHGLPGLSQSTLKSSLEVPARVLTSKKETGSMRLGSLIHAVLLQPTIAERRYVRTTLHPNSNAYKDLVKSSKAEGRIVVAQDKWDEACMMRDAVMSQQAGRDLIRPDTMKVEQSFWWRDWETALLCRGRSDIVYDDPDWEFMVDLKGTEDASERAFANKIGEFGYDLQHVYYQEGWEQAMAQSRKNINDRVWRPRTMIFLAIEWNHPHLCNPIVVRQDFLERSRQQVRDGLRNFRRYVDAGVFPAFSPDPKEVGVPEWAYARRQIGLETHSIEGDVF